MEEKLRYPDLDVEQFWKDDAIAQKDNCFYEGAPQVAFGVGLWDEDVFAELNVPGDPMGENPPSSCANTAAVITTRRKRSSASAP